MNYHITILPSEKKTINKKELLQTTRWYFVCNNDKTPNEYNCEKYKNFQSAIENYSTNTNTTLISTLAKPISENKEPSRKSYKFNDTDVFFYN
jgi:hypothetical protein